MNINFTYYLGDNTLEVSAEVSPIIPAVLYPNDLAQPAEGGEVEITGVHLVGETPAIPFEIDGVFIAERGIHWKDKKPYVKYISLEDALIEAAGEEAEMAA